MKVNDLSGVLRGLEPSTNHRSEAAKDHAPAKETRTDYGDSLDLSLSARATVNSPDAPEISAADSSFALERLAEIRTRISQGFYSQPTIEAEIADRVLGFYAR
jgi:hypothetical protein